MCIRDSYICAANGGAERAPAWYSNLSAGGPAEIERKGLRSAVTPVVLKGTERDRAFERVYFAFPHVRLYLARTSRTFPVLRLDVRDALEPVASKVLVGDLSSSVSEQLSA